MKFLQNIKTMSSRMIAELTDKRHDNVLRDCDKLNSHYEKMGLLKIEEGYFTHPSTGSHRYRQYLLTRMQTFDLITGYDAKLRIKVNRRWEELEMRQSQIDLTDPQTILQIAQNWAEESKKRKEAENKIKTLQPKADFTDRVIDTNTLIDVGQVAKLLELPFGRNTLFRKLRESGIFFKNKNEPMQRYVDQGLFRLKEILIQRKHHPDFMVMKVLVTQKGLLYLSKMFGKEEPNKQLALIQ